MEKIMETFTGMSLYMKIAIGVLVILVLYFIYSKYQQKNLEGMQGMPGNQNAGGEIVCTMYYTDGCPHCVKAKPEWAKFEEAYHGKNVNGKTIVVTKVNCEQNPEIADKEGIKGFPTFKFVSGGQSIDYQEDRTFDSFANFVEKL